MAQLVICLFCLYYTLLQLQNRWLVSTCLSPLLHASPVTECNGIITGAEGNEEKKDEGDDNVK